jgi:hypothetical protein
MVILAVWKKIDDPDWWKKTFLMSLSERAEGVPPFGLPLFSLRFLAKIVPFAI